MSAHRWISCTLTIAVAIGMAGCGSSSDSGGSGASMDELAGAVDAQKEARTQQEAEAADKAAADKNAAADQQAAANQAAPQPRKVGDRPPLEGGGYLRAIAGARRHVMNVVDNLSWIQGVRNFKGEKGRKPKDHAEFMKDCVKAYDLQLPRIGDDEEYLYDPNGETDGDFGQLYVIEKQPAPQSAPAPTSSPPQK